MLLDGRVVPRRLRLCISAFLGCVAGGVTLQKNILFPYPRDFGQVWFAARALLHGQNPYPLVGPHLAYDWPWPLLYPLPAAVIAMPFAPFSVATASVLFSILVGAAFAWALMEYGYGPLFGFFSGSLHFAAEVAQWSPLFAAAVVVPPLSFFLIAKPTIGAAIFAARPSKWALWGAIVLTAISFALQPTWLGDWIGAVAGNNRAWLPHHPYQVPALAPGGILALLCLLRWRRPEARLVAALACVPQTPMLYETVPLFLVPRSFAEATTLFIFSYGQHHILEWLNVPGTSPAEYMDLSGRLIAVLMYLPATVMVLRRPNEGDIPLWLGRMCRSWPRWMRGSAAGPMTSEAG